MNNDEIYAQGLLRKALNPATQPEAIRSFCLTNTWGTMSDKLAVFEEMKRLSPRSGSRLLTVYAASSVPARREWYANMGHEVRDATDREIVAAGGFRSEHFTEDRLRGLLGSCELRPIGDIAYVAQC